MGDDPVITALLEAKKLTEEGDTMKPSRETEMVCLKIDEAILWQIGDKVIRHVHHSGEDHESGKK